MWFFKILFHMLSFYCGGELCANEKHYDEQKKRADGDETYSLHLLQGQFFPSHPVMYPVGTFGVCAIRAAVECAPDLHTVADDTAAAVLTGGSQLRDRALKAVEDVALVAHDDLEGFIIVIPTLLTLSHNRPAFHSVFAWFAPVDLEARGYSHD